ncbi:UDP-4-amino-4,6-dideoxy-N-acetyl-beta-L-altrosamine transaminase [Desulfosporosinus nitroreducens]|uniref:UDP-4-amino-4, 6-dideoxy-N-acetyl-beta-L-altrosamine transaminase n=1 Tax=Desulfosporosinus nitroreducens TaxID=2018668 RepID=UPI00207C9C88|nr:UDP-4-amino-4,6-dideoxy-N-acetyl-beta-L-altrosamine transaminase [Desulfosporosinus nitroreducens]MCO1603809.1 UDP-4-amino-4,6-dideoxy-N-acetyl-beta-L-altrosamine transaminase [Desulfosporosinus nitroreducens]
MKTIPYGRQDISEEDVLAVQEVLSSDWLTQGPAIEQFEKIVADYCGAKYALAVTSATAALHIGCLALDLGFSDVLWTTPNTFVASANCGRYCGANVDFVDIDPLTYNMSVTALEEKLEFAKRNGELPKVLVPVHFGGQSCEMERIAELSKIYGFKIIEDASHALGGSYKATKVGSCEYSEMTVFSFHPVKIITTGEGGMILTNQRELYERLVRLRSHGITRDYDLVQGNSDGSWHYQQIELGYNYRMTDIQATLGVSQMVRLNKFVERRNKLAERYDKALKDLPLFLPWLSPNVYSAYHLYVIQLKLDVLVKSRKAVFDELRSAGINVNVHYIPVHTQPYYQKLGFNEGDFPQAEKYYAGAITLPLYYGLTEDDQDYAINKLKEVVS